MEVGVVTDTPQSLDSLVAEKVAFDNLQSAENSVVEDTADSLEVFSYKHESGVLVSATVKEMGGCALLGSLPEKQMAILARGYMLEQQRLSQNEEEEKPEDTEEVERVDGKEPQQKSGAGRSEQKPSGVERTEQKTSRKEAIDIPGPIKQITSQEITAAPANAATANKSSDAKAGISRAGETSSGTPPAAIVSSSSSQETKAYTVSIPEISQDIVKAARPITEAESTRGIKPAIITQKIPAMSLPELSKKPSLGGGKEAEEEHDEILPSETQDEVSAGQKGERPFAEDEENLIPPTTAVGDFFLEETADPEAELFLECELVAVDGQWAKDEVVRLRELGVEEESSTASVFFAEINKPEVAGDLPVEEVEHTVIELVERIEAIDTEEAEMVYEILDKIAHKVEAIIAPIQVAESGQEEDESGQVKLEVVKIEAKLEEELRGLFIELFDCVGMEYSPELIEAFTKLALKLDILELIPKTELMEKSVPNPSQGTHEIIKQLLGALTAIKQAAERAYAIGKSVLLLYRHQLASA